MVAPAIVMMKGYDVPTSEAPTKQNRATWLDVLPEGTPPLDIDSFLTRDEVIEELTEQGVDVDAGALVWWEKAGILPRPIRRHRGGAPRALYPWYAVDAVKHLRQLQEQGRTLEQIAPVMKIWTLAPIQWRDPLADHLNRLRPVLLDIARALDRNAAEIRVQMFDEAGKEIFTHEVPVPSEWWYHKEDGNTSTSTSTSE